MCRSKQTPLRRGFLFQGNANELRTVRPDPHHPGVLSRVFWAGVGMKKLVLGALLVASCLGRMAWAADYYWTAPLANTVHSGAGAACDAYCPTLGLYECLFVHIFHT